MSLPQAPLSYMKHAMGMQNIEGFRDQRRVGMKSGAFVGGGLALHWKFTNTQRTLFSFSHPNADYSKQENCKQRPSRTLARASREQLWLGGRVCTRNARGKGRLSVGWQGVKRAH